MDRLFEKFQQQDPGAKCVRIRLIDPNVDVDSLVKNLLEQPDPLREQDPVLLHVDPAGVSGSPLRAGYVRHLTELLFLGS